jgi:hypothetical protein
MGTQISPQREGYKTGTHIYTVTDIHTLQIPAEGNPIVNDNSANAKQEERLDGPKTPFQVDQDILPCETAQT